MVSHDIIAQLRQDITTAEDAGDEVAAERLRADLSAAIDAADRTPDDGSAGLVSSAAVPQPGDVDAEGLATEVPGATEPPD
ncbi:hypothetical protein AB0H76_11635 [Nocardia sp. NPDC050712]|uniref:hypothetical protein n=1 Tax=Nocardia sp. NPDC050712 TaxID=3155518 RepID=UPI0033E2B3E7